MLYSFRLSTCWLVFKSAWKAPYNVIHIPIKAYAVPHSSCVRAWPKQLLTTGTGPPAVVHVSGNQVDDLQRGSGQLGAGPKDGGGAGAVEELVVLGRDDPAADDEDVGAALLTQAGHQLRHLNRTREDLLSLYSGGQYSIQTIIIRYWDSLFPIKLEKITKKKMFQFYQFNNSNQSRRFLCLFLFVILLALIFLTETIIFWKTIFYGKFHKN